MPAESGNYLGYGDMRAAGVGLIVGGLAVLGASGQEPGTFRPAGEPKPLTTDVVVPKDAVDPLVAERARLQAQLGELLRRLNERPAAPPIPPAKAVPTGPLPRPRTELPESIRPGEGLRLATNLYRDADYDGAYRAFKLIDPSALPKEDRAFVQYMTACCLRKLNRRADAAAIFRDVAEAKDDEFVAECAVWQLSLMRSTQDLEAQLEQLRARTKGK
jgi:hypothetical protein